MIAVHVLGEKDCNSGTWITKERYNQIGNWISEHRMRYVEIKKLIIRCCGIRHEIFVELLSVYVFPQIESLYLEENKISDKGVKF